MAPKTVLKSAEGGPDAQPNQAWLLGVSPMVQGRWCYQQRYQAQTFDLVFKGQNSAKLIDAVAGTSVPAAK